MTSKCFIIIRGSYCSLFGAPSSIVQNLEEYFSYYPQNYQYTSSYISGTWDGRIKLFNKGHFPIGFLHDVIDKVSPISDLKITDYRVLGKDIKVGHGKYTLRDYQKDIIENILKYKNCSIQLATGGGKTLVAAEFIRRVHKQSVFIVPSTELLWQAKSMLENYLDVEVGVVGDNNSLIKDITVATWQTLHKDEYAQYIKDIDVIVVDECQHIGANILKQILSDCPAVYRLGMSGTLFREDGADLELVAATGPKIAEISYSYLIKNNYLVPAKLEILRMPEKKYDRYDSYNDVYDDYVINNKFRNQEIGNITNRLLSEGRKVLIFTSRIEHGLILKEIIGCDFVHSTNPNRRKIIEDYRTGKTKCLISTSLLQEGIDIPPIDALILAGPQKSLIATIQKIGRSLRPFNGKKDCIIIDFKDSAKYLSTHFKLRLNYYRKEPSFDILNHDYSTDVGGDEISEWG